MPTIEISFKDLKSLVGKNLSLKEFSQLLEYLKAEVDRREGDKLFISLEDTNRPDLWCVEGIARMIRKLIGKPTKKYLAKPSGLTVVVNQNLRNIRPYAACAVVKGIKITDDILESIIQYQEKLAENYGRKRSKVGLGVYDFDKVKGRIIEYKGVKPTAKFIPLGFEEEMTISEMLKKHPKGEQYGKLLEGKKVYPAFIDKSGEILSIPPITNSNNTGKVTTKTRNLFIEATGTDRDAVVHALNLFAMALAERGGKVYSVRIKYNAETIVTPNFKPTKFSIKPSYIDTLLGLGLTTPELKKLLKKMDYNIVKATPGSDLIVLEIPFYRKDIMHAVDVVEDVAISYGYNNIEPLEPEIATPGKLLDETKQNNLIREIMIGMQLQEVLNFTLTSKDVLFDKMNRNGKTLEVLNPISSNYSNVRDSLLPLVMKFLETNKTVEFPQKVFELGPVVLPDKKSYNKAKQENHLCAVISHSRATFTEIKSVLETLMKHLEVKVKLRHIKHPSFIDGRCGEIIVNRKAIGVIGEIHPQVLENFNLENPVVAFEINVDELW
ncbi:MAG: phenylalanine--tRNA ligase subunit beta [Nanoarchaeota archaeon]|nr:phenylalanine--tRNA ligase subunit beta [Nanoarchaeota archaeon]